MLAFVDRAVEDARDRERAGVERIALEQMRLPLIHLIELVADMMKAAAPGPLAKPASLRELFSPTNLSYIDWIDLGGQPGTITPTDWYRYLATELEKIRNKLSSTIDKYIAFLGVEIVEDVEQLCSAQFLTVLRSLATAREQLTSAGVKRGYTLAKLGPIRDTFMQVLLRTIDYYERKSGQSLPVPDSVGCEDVAPRTGSSRLAALNENDHVWLNEPSNVSSPPG